MASKIVKITRNSCSTGGDRISNLPLMVTECILEYLPLHDLVKLSFLSKHWRNIWVMLPQLILDKDFIDVTVKQSSNKKLSELGAAYCDIVNNVLLRHTGPILKFVLYIHPVFQKSTDISHWLRFVFAKGVKEFTLIDGRFNGGYLPSCLFTSEVGLTHLTLKKCLIDSLPPSFNGFKCLTSLNLEKSRCMKVNTLQSLISSCPQLESLRITVFHFENLIIHAPKLRDLAVFGVYTSILMEETTKLKMLSLGVSLNWELSNVLCCLPNVEMLILGPPFWQSSHCKKTLKITNEFAQLATLKVVGMPVYCNGAIPFVMRLCVNSPNLQHLEIETFEMKEDCTFQRLTKVGLVSLSGSSQNLQLIKLLLARTPNLQIMTIKLKENIEGAEEKLKITRELMSYCRASTSAKILVKS